MSKPPNPTSELLFALFTASSAQSAQKPSHHHQQTFFLFFQTSFGITMIIRCWPGVS